MTHISLQWCNNDPDGVTNHQRIDCLLNRLFRHRSKEISKLRVTGLCEGNSSVTSGFPSQRASNTENVFIWWRHHVIQGPLLVGLFHSTAAPISHSWCYQTSLEDMRSPKNLMWSRVFQKTRATVTEYMTCQYHVHRSWFSIIYSCHSFPQFRALDAKLISM